MKRRTFLLAAPLAVAGCAKTEVWAPEDQVQAATYRPVSEPPALSLFTVRNVSSGNGAHSALLVTASQQVLFDPAGSFAHPSLPERNDVIFGITPQVLDVYRSYHARTSFYQVEQYLPVTPAIAERALQLVLDNGAVRQAFCAQATSGILGQLPELGGFRRTFFPDNLEAQFAQLPGVITTVHREDDSDDLNAARAEVTATVIQ